MRKVSWEIVLAGLTFVAIGIYLANGGSSQSPPATNAEQAQSDSLSHQSKTNVPGSIIIDLENLDDLKQLEQLKNLKNLKNFEDLSIELQNLDKIIKKHTSDYSKERLNEDLEKLEQELEKIDETDFRVKLQDQKVYINRDYNVEEAEWTEVNSGVYVFRESFSVSDLQSVDLNLSFGNINIVGSDSAVGEVTFRATGNIDNPAELSRNINFQKDLNSSDAAFRVESAENISLSDQINLEATLRIPSGLAVSAQTSGGHINANNRTGNQTFETSGGHITLDAMEGETVANTSGGHINVDQLSGNASLITGGGHIKVNESTGSLSAQTSGGHIEIKEAAGSISAKTSGGNISASITDVNGPLEFSTSAGNISLNIPRDLAATLDVSGSTVELGDQFNFSGTRHQGSLEGSINDGGIPLVVKCGYGSVTINAYQ